ncbi:MAG TPA: hypothetical protein VKE94_06090, partial [Gemmataceae bacterium]|nr:hypothetical protein [Gemmataceae bacterium]
PDSANFMIRAYDGLHGGKVWRGDYQFLPGYPYLLYWLSWLFPWPINTPLRLLQHGCLVVSHACGYAIVATLTRSRSFAVIVALSGLTNLGFAVLGNQLISEPLYSALVSVTALLLCNYAVRPRSVLLILAGLSIGAASLVRATGVYVAWLPIILVAATVWRNERPGRQLLALVGCLGLVAACISPVVYLNRTRLHYWGLTHYLGINLYARVVEYDGVFDAEAPAQRQILDWWEQRQAERGAPTSPPAWRTHWGCARLAMEEGGLNQAQADDLLRRAALEGIRKDPLGYLRRTANNLVDALAGDYRLYEYTRLDPPPVDYPTNYYAGEHVPTWSPYHFNKASLVSHDLARYYEAIDCFEPFGGPGVAARWNVIVRASMDAYFGFSWDQRHRLWAWLTVGGALMSLTLRPRSGWWVLFGLVFLHVGGAVAVEWPLPRYRLPFDTLLGIYPWLCVVGPLFILRNVATLIISGSTVKAEPPLPATPAAA